jgi:hypothetical protein
VRLLTHDVGDRVTLVAHRCARAPCATKGERAWVQEDLPVLTLDVCRTVAPSLGVEKLDAWLGADASVDADALGRALELLRRPAVDDFNMPGSTEFSVVARLGTLGEFVERARRAAALSPLEWALQRSLIGDGQFDGLLIALRGHDEIRASIRNEVRLKLSALGDEDVLDLLSRYESETSGARDVRIELDRAIADRSIFRVANADAARDRCADYIAIARPLLERRMLEKGLTYLPADFVGIASILSWQQSSPVRLRPLDAQVISSVCRIAACCGTWRGRRRLG